MRLARRDRLFGFILFAVFAAALAWWAVSDELGSVGGDNAVYVLTARHYSPLRGPDAVARGFAEQSQYPPLYPLSLSLVADSLSAVHAVTIVELAAAIALLYLWGVSQGLSRGVAFLASVLFGVMPGTGAESLQIHSEPLYLALSVLALLWIERAKTSALAVDALIATLAVTAAALTRTVGVCLFVPLALVISRLPWKAWLLCACAAAPLALWHLVHTSTHSYTSVLQQGVGASPLAFLTSAWGQLPFLRAGWIENLLTTPTLVGVADALLAACLLATLVRTWRRCADGWYVIAYLAIVALWDFPAEATRFVWVVMPVMIVQLLLELDRFSPPQRIAPYFAAGFLIAVLAICVVPSVAVALQRVRLADAAGIPAARRVPEWYGADPQRAEEYAVTYLSLMRALHRAAEAVPPGECIISTKPSVVSLLTGRASMSPPRADLSDASFNAALAQTRCSYVLMTAYRSPTYPQTMYPADRIRSRAAELFREQAELSNGMTGDVAILARLEGTTAE